MDSQLTFVELLIWLVPFLIGSAALAWVFRTTIVAVAPGALAKGLRTAPRY